MRKGRNTKPRTMYDLISPHILGRVIGDDEDQFRLVDFYKPWGVFEAMKDGFGGERPLSPEAMLRSKVIPQSYKLSDDEDFARLIESEGIHENDILEFNDHKLLVIALVPEAYYPINTIERMFSLGRERRIAYNGFRISNDSLLWGLLREITSSGETKEFKFYDAKLKERGL